ncbi:glycosyltransferase [Marinobacter metalliresistant]|uniref:Glycosyltransferase n=1 Tax=Marinobacter metalliresistant TaxID=2961995 RepID=A0ABZ2W4S0_9GAMM
MLAIWLLRPNLQKKFPLHNNQRTDYLAFLAWCTAIGRRECRILTEIEEWNRELQKPVRLPASRDDKWNGTFTVGMYLAGLHRAKYWDAQIQANGKLRHRAARWYFREGRQLLSLGNVQNWQIKALESNFANFEAFKDHISLPDDDQPSLKTIEENCKDIEAAWGNHQPESCPDSVAVEKPGMLIQYLASLLPVSSNRLLSVIRKKSAPPGTAQVTKVAKKINEKAAQHKSVKSVTGPFGVNLYGYAKGELGIGEDVRMLALALQSAGIPFCIINIELGKDVSQKDASVDDWVVSEPKYSVNVFCMTGIEMCRYICERGSHVLAHHYTIGLWPWELPAWPEAWHHTWSLVDEIWGVSHYTADAYAKAPVPVVPIRLPVVVGKVAPLPRSHWILPDDAYLFVFSFDMNSRPTRKNPHAVIKAFKLAAEGKDAEEAGLVLKISHLKPQSPEWVELEELIDNDPRIHLVTTELRRPEVLALYRNCDCYVSLHRSEGFGRGLAEAQLLGLPLIATGYSGNMEFCQPPTQCVDFSLIELGKNDYFYGEGQHWAEPDTEQAAQLMKHQLSKGRSEVPVQYYTDRFSPESCGEIFKQRLQAIAQPVPEKGEFSK